MIVQGSNNPIRLIFEDINDVPEQLSAELSNELGVLRHWETLEMDIDRTNMEVSIPVTQQESMQWESGPCTIKVKMLDAYGNTVFASAKDYIVPWNDNTILEG